MGDLARNLHLFSHPFMLASQTGVLSPARRRFPSLGPPRHTALARASYLTSGDSLGPPHWFLEREEEYVGDTHEAFLLPCEAHTPSHCPFAPPETCLRCPADGAARRYSQQGPCLCLQIQHFLLPELRLPGRGQLGSSQRRGGRTSFSCWIPLLHPLLSFDFHPMPGTEGTRL